MCCAHFLTRVWLCDFMEYTFQVPLSMGILQARTLEWVAISFSNAWKWKVKVKSLSRVWLLATLWTAAYQAPPSMGFSRQGTGVGCHCLLHIHIEKPINCKWIDFNRMNTVMEQHSDQETQHYQQSRRLPQNGWKYLQMKQLTKINLQCVKIIHIAQYEKNKQCNQNMGGRPKQTFLWRRHIHVQQIYEKMLNITNY